jgi:hypothetical protein
MKTHHEIQLHDPALGLLDLPENNAASLLAPLFEIESPSMLAHRQAVAIGEETYELPRMLFLGQRGGGVPIRVGIFAGFDAGRLETVAAIARLLLQFELSPAAAREYAIFAYPIVNAPGFGPDQVSHARLQGRWAKNPREADAAFFRSELERLGHHGLIQLRSSAVNPAFTATTRSALLAREVVAPALKSLEALVPVDAEPVRVLPSTLAARATDRAAGRLVPSWEPWPFEIELFAPAAANPALRASALFLATLQILRRYRRFIAHGGEL